MKHKFVIGSFLALSIVTSPLLARSCSEEGMEEKKEAPAKPATSTKAATPSTPPLKTAVKVLPLSRREQRVDVKWKDMALYVGGRIRSEHFYINNFGTLGAEDFFDEHGWFRQKVNIDTLARYGKIKYGKSVADGRIRLTAFTDWRDARRTPISEETINIGNAKFEGEHRHEVFAPLWYLEEAWLDAHVGRLWGVFEGNENSLRAGYFKYILGRGVTLGEYFDISITYMGWDADASSNATFKTPGVLWHGTILPDQLTYDLYYQKWREFSNRPAKNRAPVRQHRITGHRPERGRGSDWDIWTARLDYKVKGKGWSFWAQPYVLYHVADDQEVELDSDADARLGTWGFMLDGSYGGFSFNIEFAEQFGNQVNHAIDRNLVELEADSEGKLCEVYSHIFVGNSKDVRSKAPRTSGLSDLVDQPFNRDSSRNGLPIINEACQPVDVNGNPTTNTDNQVFNSNLSVFGNRIRDELKLKFSGFMLLGDFAYQFKNPSLKIAVTGGYISGDQFPYNEEVKANPCKVKKYNGFVTLQDSDYLGWDVNSFALLYSRAIPRPTDVNERRMFAENNRDDMSNLAIFGFNCTWTPHRKPKRIVVNPGVLFYWQTISLPKWDKTAVHPDPVVEAIKGSLGIVGWQSETEKASKYIGAEINIDFYYNITDNLQFRFLAAALFPGALYEDIDGMPNRQTRRVNENGGNEFRSLAHDTVYGMLTRLTYYF